MKNVLKDIHPETKSEETAIRLAILVLWGPWIILALLVIWLVGGVPPSLLSGYGPLAGALVVVTDCCVVVMVTGLMQMGGLYLPAYQVLYARVYLTFVRRLEPQNPNIALCERLGIRPII